MDKCIVRYTRAGETVVLDSLSLLHAKVFAAALLGCPQFSGVEILNADGTPYIEPEIANEPVHSSD